MASSSNNVNNISKVLQSCYSDLVQDLRIGNLVDYLFQEGCINREEKNCIQAIPVDQARNRELLDILLTKDDRALDVMLSYFQEDRTQLHLFRIVNDRKTLVSSELVQVQGNRREALILHSKWWPEEKPLISSFLERVMDFEGENTLVVDYIHIQLQSDRSTGIIPNNKQSIVGMGGVGKTTTAKWYANKYRHEYTHIIWIDSEGPEKAFEYLAKELNMTNQCLRKDFCETVKEVYNRLKDTTCLFVFDNAESYDGQNGIRRLLPQNSLHYTIITSRYQEWGNTSEFGQIPTFELHVFTPSECIDFLKLGTREEYSDEMEELGKELDYLPLALHIAVAIINKSNNLHSYTISSCLDRIRQDIRVVTEQTVLEEYEKSVSTSLQLTLDHIATNNLISKTCKKLCETILYVSAYCVPVEIPLKLFEGIPGVDKGMIPLSIHHLLAYSVISMVQCAKSEALSIHRLLQVALRERINSNLDKMTEVMGLTFACMETDLREFAWQAHHAWELVKQYNEIVRSFSHIPLNLLSQNVGYIERETIQATMDSIGHLFVETDVAIVVLELISAYNSIKTNAEKHMEIARSKAESLATALSISVDGNPVNQQLLVHVKLLLVFLKHRGNSLSHHDMLDLLNLYKQILEKPENADIYNGIINGHKVPHCMLKQTMYALPFRIAILFDCAYLKCAQRQQEWASILWDARHFKYESVVEMLWDYYTTKVRDSSTKVLYLCLFFEFIRDNESMPTDLYNDSMRKCYEEVTQYNEVSAARKTNFWLPTRFDRVNTYQVFLDISWAYLRILILQGKVQLATEVHNSILRSRRWDRPEDDKVNLSYFDSGYELFSQFRNESKYSEALILLQIIWASWRDLFAQGGRLTKFKIKKFPKYFNLHRSYTSDLIYKLDFVQALQSEKVVHQLFFEFINRNDLDLIEFLKQITICNYNFVNLFKNVSQNSESSELREIYILQLNTYSELIRRAEGSDIYLNDIKYKLIDIYDSVTCIRCVLHEVDYVISITETVVKKVVEAGSRISYSYFSTNMTIRIFPILELMGERSIINKLLGIVCTGICTILKNNQNISDSALENLIPKELFSRYPRILYMVMDEVIKLINDNEILGSIHIVKAIVRVQYVNVFGVKTRYFHNDYVKRLVMKYTEYLNTRQSDENTNPSYNEEVNQIIHILNQKLVPYFIRRLRILVHLILSAQFHYDEPRMEKLHAG